jgi:hypothetical protein
MKIGSISVLNKSLVVLSTTRRVWQRLSGAKTTLGRYRSRGET